MPYILSPLVTEESEAMWGEGTAYQKEEIYSIRAGKLPPVNYDRHIFNAHSLTHAEAARHVANDGKTIDQYFQDNFFYGSCRLVRLKGNQYKEIEPGLYHWEVKLSELKEALGDVVPKKLLLTTDTYFKNSKGYHDPNYVLTLDQEAADWLVSSNNFNLYGTSWKSTDFSRGSRERPIHQTIFSKAVILECLELSEVPEGEYFLVAYPLNLKGASESPLTPVLFTFDELKNEM
ncbi:cyclase family protein [Halobacteriovorax sp. GB3]|uniref:cyclase family protein n=1 Tax=Halobacteriovorax sp. GB3 TaxID=2719615 RepID=UPI002361F7B9|nr:cyclase family protein [Halobacteriovorax sp. GB3]MDD0854339.1 cyclase family protein [Halobacteriovorax sp. GB3]